MSRPAAQIWGRPFLGPSLDYLLIGGGLSLLWFAALDWVPALNIVASGSALVVAVLVANCAHFASSTVRLYTKPGATREMPVLTMVFPAVMLVVLTLCLAGGERLGPHLQALYLTWSPYHYAAQAYGLAVMYSYRSGCQLSLRDKRWLRIACLLPFFFSFVTAIGAGLDWLVPRSISTVQPWAAFRLWSANGLRVLIFVVPLLVYARQWRTRSGPMPMISLLVVIANGYWWVVAPYYQAFLWATVFHGIQYLAIVMVFHAKDQVARPGNRHRASTHALAFYAICLVLAYALFHLLPRVYMWAGFGYVESLLLVVAAINVHHFVVDAYIWKVSRGSNRRIVDDALPAAA